MMYVIRFLERFWFSEPATVRLSACRVVVVAAQLFLFFPPLGEQLQLATGGAGLTDPQLFLVTLSALIPLDVLLTPEALTMLYWGTVGVGVATLIGLATRLSAFLFALGNWFLIAHVYSYGEEHHSEAILCIFLMLLAFAPSGRRFSVDALLRRVGRYRRGERAEEVESQVAFTSWPLKLVQVLLAYTYFCTGLAKVAYGGIAWVNGYTLQFYVLNNATAGENSLGIWLAQQHLLCQLLSIGTILFELFFFVILFIPKLISVFILAGTLFHAGIYLTIGAPFFTHIVLYLVFIDFEHWGLREPSPILQTSVNVSGPLH